MINEIFRHRKTRRKSYSQNIRNVQNNKKNILDNFLISAELPESLAVDGYALQRCPQAKYKHYLPRTKAANQMLTYALNGYLALVTKTDQTKTIYIINVFVDTVSK